MDPFHILIWKMCGLNSTAHQDSIRVLVNSTMIDIMCLQETKVELVSRWLIFSISESDFDNNFIFLPSVGASGTILMAWRTKVGAIGASKIDSHSVLVQLCPDNTAPWLLIVVYGLQGNEEKLDFLQELWTIGALCARPWMLAGNFNMIYKDDDDKINSNLN